MLVGLICHQWVYRKTVSTISRFPRGGEYYKKYNFLFFLAGFLAGCGGPSSYEQGKEMAEKLYGGQDTREMVGKMGEYMMQAQVELEKADNKKEWWKGFCARGEEIWLERMDEINKKTGQKIMNPEDVRTMFANMRESLKE